MIKAPKVPMDRTDRLIDGELDYASRLGHQIANLEPLTRDPNNPDWAVNMLKQRQLEDMEQWEVMKASYYEKKQDETMKALLQST